MGSATTKSAGLAWTVPPKSGVGLELEDQARKAVLEVAALARRSRAGSPATRLP